MRTSENKVTQTLLSMIRRRRSRHSRGSAAVAEPPKADGQKVRQREAQFSDFAAVADLRARQEFGLDSLEHWERLWSANPALAASRGRIPMGWVLEAGDRLVGYLGNVPLLYQYGELPLVATTASAFVVDPAYRAWGAGMMASFYRQEHADLLLNTSAIEAVAKIARALRAEPLPQPDYEKVLFWVLDSHAFSKALLRKMEMNGAMVQAGAACGMMALFADRAIRGKRPKGSSRNLEVSEVALQDAGEEFQDLWLRKSGERPRLLANRTPELLRWHCAVAGSRWMFQLLACRTAGRLAGYALFRSYKDERIGLRVSSLVDLFAEKDDPAVVASLVAAAYAQAKRQGNHVFEVLGFPRAIRQVCLEGRPYSRSYPNCPFYYRASDRAFHTQLAGEDAWYATPFDGDTTLSL